MGWCKGENQGTRVGSIVIRDIVGVTKVTSNGDGVGGGLGGWSGEIYRARKSKKVDIAAVMDW